jgi:hypothetical protein
MGAGRLTLSDTNITDASGSVFLGYDTRAASNNQINQIVIGDRAIGLGSNTVVLGNTSIVTTALRGNVGIGTTTPTSASLTVNGNVWALSFTGSLQGTSSFAISSSNATTASFVAIAQTASFVTASNVFGPFGSNSVTSASFAISSSQAQNAQTASFTISASFAQTAISASYASTASFAQTAISSSYASTASFAQTAISSSYAL